MSNLKGIVHQKNREIMTGRIAIGCIACDLFGAMCHYFYRTKSINDL